MMPRHDFSVRGPSDREGCLVLQGKAVRQLERGSWRGDSQHWSSGWGGVLRKIVAQAEVKSVAGYQEAAASSF